MLDILSVFGDYSGGRLEVPILNARFMYNPKTAFVLPVYLVQHGTRGARLRRCLGIDHFQYIYSDVYSKNVSKYRVPQYLLQFDVPSG